ncbi:MAG: hypothetical protein ACI3Y0_01305 [Prevotella sp.]
MKKILITIAVLTATTAASAQGNIERLFDELDTKKNVNLIEKNNYEDDKDVPTTFCHYKVVMMSKADFGNLDNLIVEAFTADNDSAYSFYRKTNDAPNAEKIKISYGTRNEQSVTFGSYNKHNYLVALFRDKGDQDKRHAYAMVWYEDDGNMRISRYHIYGNDPKKSSSSIILDNDNIIITDNFNTLVTRQRTLGATKGVTNDIEFMKRFGMLRAAFLAANKNKDEMYRVGAVMKIVELCKEYSHLLSPNERSTCEASLGELAKQYDNDTYLAGMLKEAQLLVQKR